MACFFENNMVKELVEYECALHRTLEIPITAICAYDHELIIKEGGVELLRDLLSAHSAKLEGLLWRTGHISNHPESGNAGEFVG